MKKLALVSLFALTSLAHANVGQVYNCKQHSDWKAPFKGSYSARVEVLRDVTGVVRWGSDYDYVWQVKMDVHHTLNGKKTRVKSFTSYANQADVIFNVTAAHRNGVSLTIYFDELEQSSMTIDNRQVRFDCGL